MIEDPPLVPEKPENGHVLLPAHLAEHVLNSGDVPGPCHEIDVGEVSAVLVFDVGMVRAPYPEGQGPYHPDHYAFFVGPFHHHVQQLPEPFLLCPEGFRRKYRSLLQVWGVGVRGKGLRFHQPSTFHWFFTLPSSTSMMYPRRIPSPYSEPGFTTVTPPTVSCPVDS